MGEGRGHVEDRRVPRFQEQWNESAAHVEDAVEVDRDQLVPLLRREVGDGRDEIVAGIVDHRLRPPHVCLTKSRRRATSASFDTSAAKASDLAPALSSAALTPSSLAWVRPTKTVVAPSSASASAVARPMPPAAPVTITTSSLNRSFCSTASSLVVRSADRAIPPPGSASRNILCRSAFAAPA